MGRGEISAVLTSLFSLFFLFFIDGHATSLGHVCSSSCGNIGNISYPFRLKGDPSNCGDAGYELSCENNRTILDFYSGKYYVKQIFYNDETIHVVDVNFASGNCALPYGSITKDVIEGDYRYRGFLSFITLTYTSFVNCSNAINEPKYRLVPCLSGNTSHVYVMYNSYKISDLHESCRFVSMAPGDIAQWTSEYLSYAAIQKLLQTGFNLTWSVECRDCLKSGDDCAFSYVNEQFISVCSDRLWWRQILRTIKNGISSSLSVVLIGRQVIESMIITRFVLGLIILVFLIHKLRKTRKPIDTIEKFLRNRQTLKRYSYTDIIGMTSHFREKLGQGGFGSVYKGHLPNGSIAVKMLESSKYNGEDFINEVSTIGRIHHVNVVQLIGFCSEGSKRALVYEYMPNGSLDKLIFSTKGKHQLLSWDKLLEIALGTARGIEYLHQGCDMCILHFDIKPHNILLDHSFTPKVSDFGLAKLYPKDYDFVSVSTTRGTIGYIAPELISRNFGVVSYKSDVYSFGMLLLEMAGRRKNVNQRVEKSSQIYFPSWVYDQLDQGKELEIEGATETQMTIGKKLCIVGLWCIQMKPADRPSMSKVVEMLEGNIDDLQMPPKPVFSSPEHSIRGSQPDSNSGESIFSELE